MPIQNVVIIGDNSSGKTCLMKRFSEDIFKEEYPMDININHANKTIFFDGSKTRFNIYDAPGSKRLQKTLHSVFENSSATIACYDTTKPSSYDEALERIRQIHYRYPEMLFVLVGTKIDITDKKAVNPLNVANEIESLPHVIAHFETSAKDNTGVDDVFQAIARENKPEDIDVNEFKILYKRAYKKKLFANPCSYRWDKDDGANVAEIEKYANLYPKSRTAKVLYALQNPDPEPQERASGCCRLW